jgi:hypothetical protein
MCQRGFWDAKKASKTAEAESRREHFKSFCFRYFAVNYCYNHSCKWKASKTAEAESRREKFQTSASLRLCGKNYPVTTLTSTSLFSFKNTAISSFMVKPFSKEYKPIFKLFLLSFTLNLSVVLPGCSLMFLSTN